MMRIAGIPVVNAKNKVKITITPNDVKNGDTKDPAACAAARACMRDLHATEARVHIGRTYLKIDEKWHRFQTSKSLRTEIVAFDRGGKFEPGEYTLNPISKYEHGRTRKGFTPHKDRKYTGKIKKNKKSYHVVTGIRPHGANR
jgi:hypothetical protein